MGSLWNSLRAGMRAHTKQPTFLAAVVLTLALGIGATTAMFSVVYGVLLRPLPFGEPDRLVRLWTVWTPGLGRGAVSAANGRDWRAQNRALEDVALIHRSRQFNFTAGGEPERLRGARVSAGFFSILRVSPLLGRTFTEQENEIGHDGVVVLSHALWLRHFGADPGVIGRTIPLNGVATTVIGVMKPDFRYPSREFELWVPLTASAEEYLQRTAGSYMAIGRLRPGVTLEAARADLAAVSANLAREYPEQNARVTVGIGPLLDDLVGDVRRPLFVLLAAVVALLLIGCANLTNLLLARGLVRQREVAVRAALGATRPRLVAESVLEFVPLLVLGGVLGLLVASWAVRAVTPLLPPNLPRTEAIGISLPVLGFSTAVIMLVGLLLAAWPALSAASGSVRSTLGELSRGNTAAAQRTRVRDLLVVGQIAMTLLLLVGALVLVRSFLALRQVSPGLDPDRVLSVHVAIPRTKYPLDGEVATFYARVLEQVRALPGVAAAGMVSRLPLGGDNQTGGIQVDESDPDAAWPSVQTRTASPDYFRALGIPIREGRSFTDADRADAPGVAIIDERLARSIWPGQSPIGRRIREGGGPWSTIVGVAGHVRHTGLHEDAEPQVYWNHPQRVEDRMALVIKTEGDPAALVRPTALAVRQVDPDQPIYDARPLVDVLDRSLAQRWLQTLLLGAFALLALLLASIGTYGVIAYGVGQRLREFGVRSALGARRLDLVALVIQRGGLLFAAGAVVGLALAASTVRVLSTLVYEVPPHDPWSFALSVLALFVVSLAACYLPARRAARVEPSIALRSD